MSYSIEQRTQRVEELVRRFRATEGRVTPQRLAVLRALVASDRHPSVDDIYRELHPAYPTMSEATVYKTIDRLKSLGEVLELEFSDKGNRYDAMRPAPHVHLVCVSCGVIADAEIELPIASARTVASRSGFALRDVRFDVYGRCRACRTGS